MRAIQLAVAFVATLAASAGQVQAGVLYLSDNSNNLRAIDPDTFTVSNIGSLGTNFLWSGLAHDPNADILYGVDGRAGTFDLFTINRLTGAATSVGSHGVPELFGLAFDSTNNVLYSSQLHVTEQLYRLDTTSGAATLVGPLTGSPGIGGLAYDSLRDQLIGWHDFGGEIYSIDRNTGATSLLTNGPSASDGGLAYDADRDLIWGVDITSGGTLFSLDPNASYTRTNHLTGIGGQPTGLAYINSSFVPAVPEPSSLTLFGIGACMAGVGGARRRRREK